jgi:hypothetical protein
MIEKTLVNLAIETRLKWLKRVDLNRIYNIKSFLHRSDLTESSIQLELIK